VTHHDATARSAVLAILALVFLTGASAVDTTAIGDWGTIGTSGGVLAFAWAVYRQGERIHASIERLTETLGAAGGRLARIEARLELEDSAPPASPSESGHAGPRRAFPRASTPTPKG
jgi:hypothetical protein